MEAFTIIVSSVSMLGALVAIYYALRNGKKTDEKEFQQRVEENTRINIKLDDISSKTSDIKAELQNISKTVQSHDIKLAELDIRTKELEKRVDLIEHRK